MRSATKIGCAAIAALTCAGSAAAALPIPPEPPLPLPLPTLPAPLPLPPVALPPAPPAPPAPLAPLPAAPSVPSPVAPPALAAQPSATTSSGTADGQTSSTSDAHGTNPTARSTSAPPRDSSIRAGKVRRSGRGVAIGYALARSGRVYVVLRGPIPDCAIVSRFSVHGKRGANALRFNRTVGRKRLDAGTYLIGLRTASGPVRWKLLAVADDAVRPVRRPAAPVARACTEPSVVAVLVSSETSSAPASNTAVPPAVESGSIAQSPRPRVLPFVGVEEAVDQLPAAAGPVLLVLLVGSLAAVGAFVVRFLRAS